MCGKSADEAFEAIARRLAAADRLLIVTHARPDGDAVGSMAALAAAAQAAGKTARVLLPDEVPLRYEFLLAGARPAPAEQFAALADEADVVVILDTCAFAQLDGLDEPIRARREKIVVADHHETVEDVGAIQWIDKTAAAAGVMIAELLEALRWPVNAAAAEALLAAIATDTGWFRYANTDGRCLRAAAKLIDAGVQPDELYARLYESERLQRVQLRRRVLESLELHAGGKVATMAVRRADFEQTGARSDETEDLVNEAMRIGGVEAAVLLVDSGDCVRASLRSRGGVDVAAVARRFGGGGHRRAAGLRGSEDLDTLKRRLIEALAEALRGG